WQFSICAAYHQSYSGPRFIDSAHFYVDKAERQRDSADYVFRHISSYSRRFFWPGYPDCSSVRNFLAQEGQSLLQFAALLDENVDKTRIGLQAIGKSYAFGNCTEPSTIVGRRVDCDHSEPRLDSELLR